MKKYELTDETKQYEGRTVYRIRALVDVRPDVKKGDVGGWVESENNLSHLDDCWIYHEAVSCDFARVIDRATLRGAAVLQNLAIVQDCAVVRDNATLLNRATVQDRAIVRDCAVLRDNATILDRAIVRDSAGVQDRAIVRDSATAGGNSIIKGNAVMKGEAKLFLGIINNIVLGDEDMD